MSYNPSPNPGGSAGGSLAGTYPNPSLGTGVVSDAEVNSAAAIGISKLANVGVGTLIGDSNGAGATGDVTVGSGLNLSGGTLTASGGVSQLDPVVKNSAYTMQNTDSLVEADASGGAFTVTLPAAPVAGFRYFVKKIDSSGNAVTVMGSSGNIDGAASLNLTAQFQSISAIFDAVNWWLV